MKKSVLYGVITPVALILAKWIYKKLNPAVVMKDAETDTGSLLLTNEANTSITSSCGCKKNIDTSMNSSFNGKLEKIWTPNDSLNSSCNSIGAEVCNIIENSRREFTENQVRLDWKIDNRILSCPSILLIKRDTTELKYDPLKYEAMDHDISNWTLHNKRYYFNGTVVVPAGNMKILLDKLFRNSAICVMAGIKKANNFPDGWYSEAKNSESENHEFKKNFDTFCFALSFYKELILFQLFANTNVLEIKQFEEDLFLELSIRYQDDLMEIVDLDTLRAKSCKCVIGTYIFLAQRSGLFLKTITERLGFSIYLNFSPEFICGECFQDFKNPLTAEFNKKDWLDSTNFKEIFKNKF